jgi:hypothetical protein
MKTTKTLCQMSVDEILTEAIDREIKLNDFYQHAVCELGPEVCSRIQPLIQQGRERVGALERLRTELADLRDLTTAMAD